MSLTLRVIDVTRRWCYVLLTSRWLYATLNLIIRHIAQLQQHSSQILRIWSIFSGKLAPISADSIHFPGPLECPRKPTCVGEKIHTHKHTKSWSPSCEIRVAQLRTSCENNLRVQRKVNSQLLRNRRCVCVKATYRDNFQKGTFENVDDQSVNMNFREFPMFRIVGIFLTEFAML